MMSVSVRSKRSFSAGARSSLSPRRVWLSLSLSELWYGEHLPGFSHAGHTYELTHNRLSSTGSVCCHYVLLWIPVSQLRVHVQSGMSSPTHAMCKDTKDLNNQLDTIRKNYERSAEKNGSLRDALKTCRKCLQERDRQLDISNRMINKLCLHREALEVIRFQPRSHHMWYLYSIKYAYG